MLGVKIDATSLTQHSGLSVDQLCLLRNDIALIPGWYTPHKSILCSLFPLIPLTMSTVYCQALPFHCKRFKIYLIMSTQKAIVLEGFGSHRPTSSIPISEESRRQGQVRRP